MNLVAKEAPLVNARDGVLILSENAGRTRSSADWAVTVNPFDVWGQAEALHEALSMEPAERARRARGSASRFASTTSRVARRPPGRSRRV